MSGHRSSIGGRDSAWWDGAASPDIPGRGPRANRDAPVPRAAPDDDAARAFARAMRQGEDRAVLRDVPRDGDAPAVRERHGRTFGDGRAAADDGDDDADADADAAARVQDVWSLFATGAIGRAVGAPAADATTPAPAVRDVVDDLFALVVALRGDESGTAVMELDLDEHALPGVSIRIAPVDDRLYFTFLCRRAEGFQRLVAQVATMADLLHERLARPVGVAVRRAGVGIGIRTGAPTALARTEVDSDADVVAEAG